MGIHGGYDDLSGIIEDESDETQHIIPPSSSNFLSFNTSLWSVVVWCCMFIFIFMILCYLFSIKKDYETEAMYKKAQSPLMWLYTDLLQQFKRCLFALF